MRRGVNKYLSNEAIERLGYNPAGEARTPEENNAMDQHNVFAMIGVARRDAEKDSGVMKLDPREAEYWIHFRMKIALPKNDPKYAKHAAKVEELYPVCLELRKMRARYAPLPQWAGCDLCEGRGRYVESKNGVPELVLCPKCRPAAYVEAKAMAQPTPAPQSDPLDSIFS